MNEIETDDLKQDENDTDDTDDEWDICWRCEGCGCSTCDFDGWYYLAWIEPNGVN
jgi:hypothetical protein